MSETAPQTINEPEQILIFDTTLRDGAQSPGIALTHKESLDIAHQLNRLNVDVIEAGFPISSPENFAAVQAIAQEVEGPIIAGLARSRTADIVAAFNAVKDSDRPRIHTFISTSDIHIEHQMDNATRESVKAEARAAVAHAKSFVEDVEFSPMDATRADIEYTAEVCQIAIDEGATTINIPDTVGYTYPEEYKAYLTKLYELVPALGGVVLSVHCHDDLGMAVSNSFAGVQSGARQVECAINGLGERAGNCSLEEFVMFLRVRRESVGFDTGINAEQIARTSGMVSRYTSYEVPGNKAIVGRNAFQHESGIHQDGVLKNRSTFEILRAADVGFTDDDDGITLGKQSGRHAVRHVLENEGVFSSEHFTVTFSLFKDLADQIGEITREQAVVLQEEAIRRKETPYRLEDHKITHKSGNDYEALISVEDSTGKIVSEGAKNNGEKTIDGPVSAAIAALKKITATDFPLADWGVKAIGNDEKTVGEAIVKLQVGDKGETVTGKGLSTDTNAAYIRAYLNAVTKAQAWAPPAPLN